MSFTYTQFQYIGAGLYFVLCFLVGVLLISFCWAVFPIRRDSEKLSVYECGFMPYDDARIRIDVHFYMISLLFLIFDLEMLFIVPWVVGIERLTGEAFVVGIIFLFVLVLGFLYEWWIGAFDMFEIKL